MFNGRWPARKAFVYNMRLVNITMDEDTTLPYLMGAIRYGKWKINNQGDTGGPIFPLGTFQLFDLKADPNETEDLFEEREWVAEKMVQLFKVKDSSHSASKP